MALPALPTFVGTFPNHTSAGMLSVLPDAASDLAGQIGAMTTSVGGYQQSGATTRARTKAAVMLAFGPSAAWDPKIAAVGNEDVEVTGKESSQQLPAAGIYRNELLLIFPASAGCCTC